MFPLSHHTHSQVDGGFIFVCILCIADDVVQSIGSRWEQKVKKARSPLLSWPLGLAEKRQIILLVLKAVLLVETRRPLSQRTGTPKTRTHVVKRGCHRLTMLSWHRQLLCHTWAHMKKKKNDADLWQQCSPPGLLVRTRENSAIKSCIAAELKLLYYIYRHVRLSSPSIRRRPSRKVGEQTQDGTTDPCCDRHWGIFWTTELFSPTSSAMPSFFLRYGLALRM